MSWNPAGTGRFVYTTSNSAQLDVEFKERGTALLTFEGWWVTKNSLDELIGALQQLRAMFDES